MKLPFLKTRPDGGGVLIGATTVSAATAGAPAGEAMQEKAVAHPNELVFGKLLSGWTEPGIDGAPFFSADHPATGAAISAQGGRGRGRGARGEHRRDRRGRASLVPDGYEPGGKAADVPGARDDGAQAPRPGGRRSGVATAGSMASGSSGSDGAALKIGVDEAGAVALSDLRAAFTGEGRKALPDGIGAALVSLTHRRFDEGKAPDGRAWKQPVHGAKPLRRR